MWLRLNAERAGWSPDEVSRALSVQGHPLPRVDFVAEPERCPRCDGELGVYKSRTRTVVSLAQGAFEARELQKQCIRGAPCPVLRSSALASIVAPRKRYTYDLIAHVGMARFLRRMQREEIRAELYEQRGIELSVGTVSNLCDRFLQLLERLHLHRAPALRAGMEGGYPLHVDATCERGKGGLLVCMNGWLGWVLGATRIPTENHIHVRPLIEKTVGLFGDPVAVVRDMGDGIEKAVEPLRERGIVDLVCHYHFAAAVGKKLFERPYCHLRNILRHSGVLKKLNTLLGDLRRYRQGHQHERRFGPGRVREDLLALVHWIIKGSGKKDSPFPFALPHVDVLRRCKEAVHQVKYWVPAPRTLPERRAIHHLNTFLGRLKRDKRVDHALSEIDVGWEAFAELRDVLRLSNAELPRADERYTQALIPAMEMLRLQEIERALSTYKKDLLRRITAIPKPQRKVSPHAVILSYLQREGDHLFGHPARRDEDGSTIAVVARTNNVVEHLFGHHKQQMRRRLGREKLAHDLMQQPAQAALVANLSHPEYVRVLCGSIGNLPAAFAEVDQLDIQDTTPLVRDHRDHQLQRRVRRLLEANPSTDPTEGETDSDSRHQLEGLPPSDVPELLSEIENTTEPVMRARCAAVFKPNPQDRQQRTGNNVEPTLGARKAQSSYPLGSLGATIYSELTQAGYLASTSEVYLRVIQRFANHHMRSPAEMGEVEISQFLLYLTDECQRTLGTYRATRTALRAIYQTALQRPNEVERIPNRPEALRALAAQLDVAGLVGCAFVRTSPKDAVIVAATVV